MSTVNFDQAGPSVSAGKRKRSSSSPAPTDLPLWTSHILSRTMAKLMMKDMYEIPLGVKSEEIMDAHGAKCCYWGEAFSWLERNSSEVDELDLLRLIDALYREYILFLKGQSDSSMALNIHLLATTSIPY